MRASPTFSRPRFVTSHFVVSTVGSVRESVRAVSVVAVDLSVQLEHLAYKIQAAQGGISFVG